MNFMNEFEVIASFLESGSVIEEAIYKGDYNLNNKETRKMYKLYKKVSSSDKDLFLNKCVPTMLSDGNYPVKIQTCNFLFDMHIQEKEAEEILIEIARDTDARLFAHQAELILHSRGIKL